MRKVNSTEAELKKRVAYKKSVYVALDIRYLVSELLYLDTSLYIF